MLGARWSVQVGDHGLRRLREKAARQGQTLEAYLEQLALDSAGDAATTPAEWVAAWRAWAAGHYSFPGVADDSRESIYDLGRLPSTP